MQVAICCDSRGEYEALEKIVMEYAQNKSCFMVPQWLSQFEEFRRVITLHRFPIVILACEDIDNQELAVSVRDLSGKSQIIWIGEDKRFGLSSYRVEAADFLLRPVAKEAVWRSLDRCMENLHKNPAEILAEISADTLAEKSGGEDRN